MLKNQEFHKYIPIVFENFRFTVCRNWDINPFEIISYEFCKSPVTIIFLKVISDPEYTLLYLKISNGKR
jgi:hypothetical protein